ncbi:uncharacterized protein [Mycetomoellerius zeteki]|uniref:uncharacterized protein isoform X2 n=1 Tax=Mycetomoellerius zeteki TaxID=64791 RepID=UPI00084ED043|nr:PREDICTED: uncharacterized protein LOC108729885 isoform X2 [Trachymyrmex zeteki]
MITLGEDGLRSQYVPPKPMVKLKMEKVAVSTLEVKEEILKKKPCPKAKAKEKQQSEKRSDDFRASTSQTSFQKNDSNAKQALYEKLYYGFKRQNEAMKSIQIMITPRSIILPISTRSIGFMIRFLICKFARLNIQNVDFHGLCSALYRVTLLQLNVKLMQTMLNQCSRNIGTNDFITIDVKSEFVRIVCELGAYFAPLVNLISSIGVAKAFGTLYIPRMVKAPTLNHIVCYDPTVINFSTLRTYVVALSSAATAYATRKYFYDHSPFPNARWTLQEKPRDDGAPNEAFPILSNADEIMPTFYGIDQLREDINIIMDAIELIGRKYTKFVHMGGVDYGGNSNFTILPSNDVEDIRCSDLTWDDNDPVYNISSPISGTIDHFWSPEYISNVEFYLGSIHLFGERAQKGARWSAYDIRSVSVAKQEASIDYNTGLQNLLG